MKTFNHGHVEINSMGMLKSIQIPMKNALPCPHCFVQRRCLAEGDGSGILRRSWQRCDMLNHCDERSKQLDVNTVSRERNIIHAMRSHISLFWKDADIKLWPALH